MNVSPLNGLPVSKPNGGLPPSALQSFKRRAAWSALLLLLTATALSLSGCTTLPPPQCEPQEVALKPVLRTPLPKVDYSSTAQQDLLMYQQRLTATSQTSKP